MRYELNDYEWSIISSNKPCAIPRVDDRRILNGHLLALAFSPTMARSARKLAFPLRLATIASFVAAGWRLGPDHGSVGCFS